MAAQLFTRAWRAVAMALCLVMGALAATASAAQPATRPDLYVVAIGLPIPSQAGAADTRPCPLDPSSIELRGTPRGAGACDALAIAAAAAAQEGRIYGNVRALAWVDDAAPPAALLSAVSAFVSPARASDQLLIYVTGLGILDRATGRYLLLTPPEPGASPLGSTLDQRALVQALTAATPARGLLIGDTHKPAAFAALRDQHPEMNRAWVPSELLPLERVTADPSALTRWLQIGGGSSRSGGAAGRGEGPLVSACAQPLCAATAELLSGAGPRAASPPSAEDPIRDFILTPTEAVVALSDRLATLTVGEQRPSFSGAIDDRSRPLLWTSGGAAPCVNEGGLCLEVVCNGVDDDGDDRVDEGFDEDGDGYVLEGACDSPWTTKLDCDDSDPLVNHDAPEVSNLLDDDCDGRIDETAGDINPANGYSDAFDARVQARQRRFYTALGLSGAAAAVAVGTVIYSRLRIGTVQAAGNANVTGEAAGLVNRSWFALTAAGAAGVGIGLSIPLKRRQLALEAERERYRVSSGPEEAGPPPAEVDP